MVPFRKSTEMSQWAVNTIRIASKKPKPPEVSIPLSQALASTRFSDLGCGIYAEDGPAGQDYGRIWRHTQVTDPRTGQKIDYLVVVTTDDDEIIRQVTASLVSEGLLFPEKGQWITDGNELLQVISVTSGEDVWVWDPQRPGRRKLSRQDLHRWDVVDAPPFTVNRAAQLQHHGVDPADTIKPMTWHNQESKNPKEEVPHVNQQLPQGQQQPGEPQVLYDTNAPPPGGKGDYTVHVQPDQKQVTVKFAPPEGGNPVELSGLLDQLEPQQQGPGNNLQQQVPKNQQQKQLSDVETPVEF